MISDFFTSAWGIGLILSLIGGGGIAALVFFRPVIAALMATKTGRAILAVGFAIGGFLLAILIAFARGRARERAINKAASQKNIENRIKTDEEVRNLPAADRRKQLDRWVRDN